MRPVSIFSTFIPQATRLGERHQEINACQTDEQVTDLNLVWEKDLSLFLHDNKNSILSGIVKLFLLLVRDESLGDAQSVLFSWFSYSTREVQR